MNRNKGPVAAAAHATSGSAQSPHSVSRSRSGCGHFHWPSSVGFRFLTVLILRLTIGLFGV
ncbi:conserved hypothetical protein [Culex quinquefasciatus]|uniref:Uncharacterized protein n=1 Tax=Culex quinquefasciatus TaxID=7176 RepID=B0WFM1_CULQU|nr:conserved hypothetical protein [Culex quinquefasciatus]|eukprot:XP_001847505.1 conserved hypothetical protein [Culex quinquefasciatus]